MSEMNQVSHDSINMYLDERQYSEVERSDLKKRVNDKLSDLRILLDEMINAAENVRSRRGSLRSAIADYQSCVEDFKTVSQYVADRVILLETCDSETAKVLNDYSIILNSYDDCAVWRYLD